MKPPEKSRDRIYRAAVEWARRSVQAKTPRQRQDAYEDFMVTVDAVIEDIVARREQV